MATKVELPKRQRAIYLALSSGPLSAAELAEIVYGVNDPYTRNCVYVHLHRMRARGIDVTGERIYRRHRVAGKIYLKASTNATISQPASV